MAHLYMRGLSTVYIFYQGSGRGGANWCPKLGNGLYGPPGNGNQECGLSRMASAQSSSRPGLSSYPVPFSGEKAITSGGERLSVG